MKEKNNYIEEILRLKKEKNAVILAHYYQPLDIQRVADYIGDSFDLSMRAKNDPAQTIVFCGVSFMAETVKILSPGKTVLNPNPHACCPMARMTGRSQLLELKKQYPGAATVCYINTIAEVKAICDVCVTSSTAVKIINRLEEQTVIFVPDKNLAGYVQKNTKKKIVSATGYCYVHNNFQEKLLTEAIQLHPDAEVIVHPECPPGVIDRAHHVFSTSGILQRVKESNAKKFIIGTEQGLLLKLKEMYADRIFYSIGPPGVCINMKKIRLSDIYESLINNTYEVEIPDDILAAAQNCLNRMIELSK